MATDLTQSSEQQLLNLINEENQSELDFTTISFGRPVALTEDEDGKNTSLVVSSAPNGGYVGDVTVKYDRLDLTGFLQYGEADLVVPEEPSLEDVISVFNAYYDANLSLGDDIPADLVLPTIDRFGQSFELRVTDDSYAFIGTLPIILRYAGMELSDFIVNRSLDGLVWPIILGERLTGAIETLGDLPESVYGNSTVVLGDILYSIGGYTTEYSSVVRRYDLANNVLLPNAASLPNAVGYSHDVAINGAIYSYGGQYDSAYQDTLHRYSPISDTWEYLGGSGYGARYAGGVSAIDSTMYVMGGRGSTTIEAIGRQLLSYDTVSGDWDMVEAPFAGIRRLAMAAILDTLYIMGGERVTGGVVIAETWSYNTRTGEWLRLADMPRPRHFHSAIAYGGRVYVYGGQAESSSPADTLYAYDPTTDTWELTANTGYTRRSFSMDVYKGAIYVPGGVEGSSADTITSQFLKIT